MSIGLGWIGTQRQVTYFLDTVGADKDEKGRFILVSGSVHMFLGIDAPDNYALVDSETCYLVNGQKVNLASGLGMTSYGHRVNVIA